MHYFLAAKTIFLLPPWKLRFYSLLSSPSSYLEHQIASLEGNIKIVMVNIQFYDFMIAWLLAVQLVYYCSMLPFINTLFNSVILLYDSVTKNIYIGVGSNEQCQPYWFKVVVVGGLMFAEIIFSFKNCNDSDPHCFLASWARLGRSGLKAEDVVEVWSMSLHYQQKFHKQNH